MTRPVTSPTSVRSKKENIFQTVDRLIDGDPLESADVNQRQLLCALCAVRNEEVMRQRTPRVERSNSLIREIEASFTPPPFRKRGPRSPTSPKSMYSPSQACQSPTSPKSPKTPKPAKSVKSIANSPLSPRSGLTTPTRGKPQKVPIVKEMSEEEYAHISEIVDGLLEGDDLEVTESLRQKIIFVIRRRREKYLDECNYMDVQCLDELVASLKARSSQRPTWRDKVNALKRACNMIQRKIGKLSEQRAEALNQLVMQQQEDRDILETTMDEEEQDLCQAIPSLEDLKVSSPKVRELRKAERRLASGGRYVEAMELHFHADEVEEAERQKAMTEYMDGTRLEMDRFLEYKQRAIATHEQKWENKKNIVLRKWDRQIEPLEAREARMQEEISQLWRDHRNDPRETR